MKTPARIFLRLINKFDLATSFFRSFELFAIKQTLKNLEVGATILDVGCAEGNIGKEIFATNKIYGLDYEMQYLLSAKKLNTYESLTLADATSMPFKDSSFQFLFSNSVLEHIEHVNDALKEAKRILKFGGLFLFTIPNDKFFSQLFFYKILKFFRFKKLASLYARERNKRLNHFHLYSQQDWEKIINECGLHGVSMKDYVPVSALMLWDLIAAFQFVLRKIFGIFLKVPLLREILLLISYMVKIVFAIVLLPFFIFVNNKSAMGCATVIVAKK